MLSLMFVANKYLWALHYNRIISDYQGPAVCRHCIGIGMADQMKTMHPSLKVDSINQKVDSRMLAI